MTAREILAASKNRFEDKLEKALVWTCKRVYTKSGFCYLVKQESREISCAIHFSKNYEANDAVGKLENVEVALNTFEKIDFFNEIVTYKDLIIGVSSHGNYNENMKMWHYKCVGSYTPISNQFLVTSEEDILENLGADATEIMLALAAEYPFIPSHFYAGEKTKYVMVRCEDNSDSLNLTMTKDEEDFYIQRKIDSVTFSFVNLTRDEALKEYKRILDESLKPEAKFGVLKVGQLKNNVVYQTSFSWKSNTYEANIEVFYFLRGTIAEESPKILDIIYEQLEAM